VREFWLGGMALLSVVVPVKSRQEKESGKQRGSKAIARRITGRMRSFFWTK
jgi:hypothetical protein